MKCCFNLTLLVVWLLMHAVGHIVMVYVPMSEDFLSQQAIKRMLSIKITPCLKWYKTWAKSAVFTADVALSGEPWRSDTRSLMLRQLNGILPSFTSPYTHAFPTVTCNNVPLESPNDRYPIFLLPCNFRPISRNRKHRVCVCVCVQVPHSFPASAVCLTSACQV